MTSNKFADDIEEFEAKHQDKTELIRALAGEGLACCMKYSFDKAFAFTSRAYELAQENTELLAEILPKHVVALYLHDPKNEKALKEFKSGLKKMENGEEIWKQAKVNLIPLMESDLKKISRDLDAKFYGFVNPFPEVVEKLQNEDELKLSLLSWYLDLAKKCKGDISGATLGSLSAVGLEKVKKVLDMDSTALRTVDEKELDHVVALIREFAKLGEGKNVDAFERELAFKLTLSAFLGKQFNGLMKLSKESFSQALVARIKEKGVVEHIFANMHQDLARPFATVLKKMWNAGAFTLETLTKFWEVTLEQHSSVIGKFFEVWPDLFGAIPKGKVQDFWALVLKTECLPVESLEFLKKISGKADDEVKAGVVEKLWKDSQAAEDRMDFVAAISDYTPNDSEGRNHVKEQCFELLKNDKGKDASFAISVLSYIWKCTNAEKSKTEFDILIQTDLGADQLKVVFDLLMKVAKTMSGSLTQTEYDAMKKLLSPLLADDTLSLDRFLREFVKIHKGKILTQECQQNLIEWLVHAPNVDESLFGLIETLFCSVNDIDKDATKITTYDWAGMEAMWELLFNSSVSSVSAFFVRLFSRCVNPKALPDFVNKCCQKLESSGALTALTQLINTTETPLDLKQLGIRRNEFLPQSQYVRISLTGDYTGYVTILKSTDLGMFKATVARLMNLDESSISFLSEGKELTAPNWRNDLKIDVVKVMMAKPARPIKKAELPSQILKEPKFFSQIFELLKSDNHKVADLALGLLNLMEPSEQEISCFRAIADQPVDWSEKLSLDEPYVLIYRMNILGNLLTENNKRYILSFFRTGGFKRMLELISTIRTDTFSQSRHFDIILYLTTRLIEPSDVSIDTEEMKLAAYNAIGINRLTSAIMNWVLELNANSVPSQWTTLYSLLFILYYIISVDKEQWLKQDRFDEFFTAVTFSKIEICRSNISKIWIIWTITNFWSSE